MDEEGFKKIYMKEKIKREGFHQPLYGTWVVDFMLRQDAGRFMLEKYLSDKKIPEFFKICIKRSLKYESKYLQNIYRYIYINQSSELLPKLTV